jgi:hypothetical protein
MELEDESAKYRVDQTELTTSEKIASLFQPTTELAPDYFEKLRQKTLLGPEKRLMLAVLEDALKCFQSAKRKRLCEEAEQWILEEGSTWIFSFENICEVLTINPEYLRQGLLRWKEKKLERIAVPDGRWWGQSGRGKIACGRNSGYKVRV